MLQDNLFIILPALACGALVYGFPVTLRSCFCSAREGHCQQPVARLAQVNQSCNSSANHITAVATRQGISMAVSPAHFRSTVPFVTVIY